MTTNQLAYLGYEENVRSNVARESENVRTDLAREEETARSNRANEELKANTLAETERHNREEEVIKTLTQSESVRHNAAMEDETHRSNVVDELEKERHNRFEEKVDVSGEARQWVGTLGQTFKNVVEGVTKIGNIAKGIELLGLI